MITGPGAAMRDTRLFVSPLDGAYRDLQERRRDGDEWIWINHGAAERLDDWTKLKRSALVSPDTPLPTDAAHPPAGWNGRTSVRAFEGAGGLFATGLFRPVLQCRMNQNDPPWCPVCSQKITSDLEVFELCHVGFRFAQPDLQVETIARTGDAAEPIPKNHLGRNH